MIGWVTEYFWRHGVSFNLVTGPTQTERWRQRTWKGGSGGGGERKAEVEEDEKVDMVEERQLKTRTAEGKKEEKE